MIDDVVTKLKKAGYRKIYVSHKPWQEEGARRFAEKLRSFGFEVVVAADVRPHRDKPHGVEDLEVVRKAMTPCDAMIIYTEPEKVAG